MIARRRPGLTLFQLLVILAIIALLLGFLIPAIAKARRNAARLKGANNLKQIALGTIDCADANNANLPPGLDDNGFSASAKILPYIEQDNLYKTIDFKKSIDDKFNAPARKAIVKTFLSPLDPRRSVTDAWGATNYLWNAGTKHSIKGSDGPFHLNSKARFPSSFPDGTSNTVMVVETLKGDGQKKGEDVRRQHVALAAGALKGLTAESGVRDFKDGKHIAGNRCASWMDGRFLQGTFNATRKPGDDRPDVDCDGTGGLFAPRSLTDVINVGLGDGSVHFVSKKISHLTWISAITPAGGEVLGSDW